MLWYWIPYFIENNEQVQISNALDIIFVEAFVYFESTTFNNCVSYLELTSNSVFNLEIKFSKPFDCHAIVHTDIR